jgi:3-isopropylmalate dehydrogenase
MNARIILLPGDGIGPEVVFQGRRVLEAVSERRGHNFKFEEHLLGGNAMDQEGNPFPKKSLQACKKADAILLGAVGGPQWDDPQASMRPEQGLLRLRQELGLFANLRPVYVFPGLIGSSPLKPEKLLDVDLLIVRELTGGIYFGKPSYRGQHKGQQCAIDTMVYTESEIRRVVQFAFQLAQSRRHKVTSVDKANILECSRLWRLVVSEVAKEFPDVEIEHQLVDSAAMRLILSASSFDVLVTSNMFGDILSDEASVLSGSLGMLPSASLGEGRLGVYEPVHGSAPDIAGKGIANPVGAVLSAAMLLRYSLGLEEEAKLVEESVAFVLSAGGMTKDLGGDLSTSAMGDAVIERIGFSGRK